MVSRVVVIPAGGVGGPGTVRPAAGRLSLTRLPARPARIAGVVRSALAATPVMLFLGTVGGDYVESSIFSIVVPLLTGAFCAYAATRGAGRGRAAVPVPVTLGVAAVYGGVAAALAFKVADTPYGAVGTWLPPVLAAALGAAAWPFFDPAPPVRPAGGSGCGLRRSRRS